MLIKFKKPYSFSIDGIHIVSAIENDVKELPENWASIIIEKEIGEIIEEQNNSQNENNSTIDKGEKLPFLSFEDFSKMTPENILEMVEILVCATPVDLLKSFASSNIEDEINFDNLVSNAISKKDFAKEFAEFLALSFEGEEFYNIIKELNANVDKATI